MEPIDLVPSGYRFLPTAEELWLTTSPTVAGAPSLAALSPSRTSTAPSRGIFSAAIGRRAISLRSASPRTAAARASIERPAAVLDSVQKQETVKSMVGGREMVVGRKSCLSFNDGRRKNSVVDDVRVRDVFVWRLRDTSSLSRQEKLALCLPGGTTIKTVETTLTEAATDTVTGDSFVGRKRNRDESSTLSAKASTLEEAMLGVGCTHPGRALQSDVSPHPTAVVQSDVSPPPTTVVQSDVSPPPTAVVQHPHWLCCDTPPRESSFLCRLCCTERSRSRSRLSIINGRWWR
ncbi:unnamed protein product [Musa acuminata subsp. burmannicoides]